MKLPNLQKFDFQSQFSMSNINQIFLISLLKNTSLGAHFLLLTFFDIINLFSKMIPNFGHLAITPIIKIW